MSDTPASDAPAASAEERITKLEREVTILRNSYLTALWWMCHNAAAPITRQEFIELERIANDGPTPKV
jgi:hypothetical protein